MSNVTMMIRCVILTAKHQLIILKQYNWILAKPSKYY